MRTTILAASLILSYASATFARAGEDADASRPDLAPPRSPLPKAETNDDRTIANYTEAIRIDPKNACVYHYKRGVAWHNKGECDKAIADLIEALRLDAQRGILSGVRGRVSHANDDLDLALADLIKDPRDALSFRLRAMDWWKKKEFDKAIADCTDAIRLDPQDAFSFSMRSWCWSEKKEHDKAIDDLTEAIAIDPKNADSLSFRAQCWVQKKEFDKAIEDTTRALEIDPKSTFAFVSRAHCWVEKKDFDRAISDYSAAIESNPRDATSFNCRALCWRDKGTFDEALYDLLQASLIDPKNTIYLNEIAWLYATCPVDKYRHGQKALEFATKACELDGWKDAGHVDTFAAACAEAGNFEKAIEWQSKAIELAPEEKRNDLKARLELFKSGKPYRQEPQK